MLGWNPMSLVGFRTHVVSRRLSNFDIMIVSGTSLQRHSPQGDTQHTNSHLHYSFGFPKGSSNRSSGVSFMFRKSRLGGNKFASAISPEDPDITGRVAMMRIRNGGKTLLCLDLISRRAPKG